MMLLCAVEGCSGFSGSEEGSYLRLIDLRGIKKKVQDLGFGVWGVGPEVCIQGSREGGQSALFVADESGDVAVGFGGGGGG